MPETEIEELSDGKKVMWEVDAPEKTVIVFEPHTDDYERFRNHK